MFQGMSPEQQAQVQAQAQNFAMRQGGSAAASGPLQAQQDLKNEGNRLHSAGQYAAASDKYEAAIRGAQGACAAWHSDQLSDHCGTSCEIGAMNRCHSIQAQLIPVMSSGSHSESRWSSRQQ